MTDHERFILLNYALADRKGRIAFKNESKLMWLLGKLMFFNPSFMIDYVTTIGNTVYFPNRNGLDVQWDVLAHELVHVVDGQARPFLFSLLYVLPQGFALLSLGAFGAFYSHWFLLSLLFLLALLPFPSPWRMKSERRSYLMSIVCDIMRYGLDWVQKDYYIECMVKIYTSAGYYFMLWDADKAREIIKIDIGIASALLGGTANAEPYTGLIKILGK